MTTQGMLLMGITILAIVIILIAFKKANAPFDYYFRVIASIGLVALFFSEEKTITPTHMLLSLLIFNGFYREFKLIRESKNNSSTD